MNIAINTAILLLQIIVDIVADDCAKNNRPCPDNSVCVRKLNADKSECECIRGYEYKKHTKTCDGLYWFLV
jgi:hypothetical protein